MKFTTPIATLISLACTQLIPAMLPVKAADFTETAIDQKIVIAVAKPYGEDKFDLLILEQIPGKQQCWSENGSNPVIIDPLLLNFDFTGKCRRATDANGYSIRIDGLDYGLEYLIRLVLRGNELVLIATSRTDANKGEIVVGSTHGYVRGFMRIDLNPGWQFTKRTFGNKVLGHFYFSTTAAAINNSFPTKGPEEKTSPTDPSGTIPNSTIPNSTVPSSSEKPISPSSTSSDQIPITNPGAVTPKLSTGEGKPATPIAQPSPTVTTPLTTPTTPQPSPTNSSVEKPVSSPKTTP
jgi:hypothetical protein